MKKLYLFLFTILFSTVSFSQSKDTIYLDENYNDIQKQQFDLRLRSSLFNIASINTDTTFFKKLRFKTYFGKLSYKKKHQLNELFHLRFGVDTTKVWIIHNGYYLSKNIAENKVDGTFFLDSTCIHDGQSGLISKDFFIMKRHRIMIRNSNSRKSKPESYHSKRRYIKLKKAELLHFYTSNKSGEEISDNIWFKDPNQLLQRTFSDGLRKYYTIVLFPNGNFCLNPHPISLKTISKKRGFKIEQKKWITKIERMSNPHFKKVDYVTGSHIKKK